MRILRRRELVAKVGLSPMQIWRLETAGKFPGRVELGPNSVGWIEAEVDRWIELRIAKRDAAQEPHSVTSGGEIAPHNSGQG